MSSMSDKAKGVGNEIAGKVKEGVGKATGNDNMEADGAGQKVKGQAQQAVGNLKDAAKNLVDKA